MDQLQYDKALEEIKRLRSYEAFLGELSENFPSIDALIDNTRARLIADKENISYTEAMRMVDIMKRTRPFQMNPNDPIISSLRKAFREDGFGSFQNGNAQINKENLHENLIPTNIRFVKAFHFSRNDSDVKIGFFEVGLLEDGRFVFRNPYSEILDSQRPSAECYPRTAFTHVCSFLDGIKELPKQKTTDCLWQFEIDYANGKKEFLQLNQIILELDKYLNENSGNIPDYLSSTNYDAFSRRELFPTLTESQRIANFDPTYLLFEGEKEFAFASKEEYDLFSKAFRSGGKVKWTSSALYDELFHIAYDSFEAEKYDAARILYLKCLECNPIAIDARFEIVNCFIKKQQYEQAKEALAAMQGILVSRESIAKFYRTLGYILCEECEYQAAYFCYIYSSVAVDVFRIHDVTEELIYIITEAKKARDPIQTSYDGVADIETILVNWGIPILDMIDWLVEDEEG